MPILVATPNERVIRPASTRMVTPLTALQTKSSTSASHSGRPVVHVARKTRDHITVKNVISRVSMHGAQKLAGFRVATCRFVIDIQHHRCRECHTMERHPREDISDDLGFLITVVQIFESLHLGPTLQDVRKLRDATTKLKIILHDAVRQSHSE